METADPTSQQSFCPKIHQVPRCSLLRTACCRQALPHTRNLDKARVNMSCCCCHTSDMQLCCQGLLSPRTVPPALHQGRTTAPPSHCRVQPASKMLYHLPAFRCWALAEDLKPAETLNVPQISVYLHTGVACWCISNRRDTDPQDRVHSPAISQLPPLPHPHCCLLPGARQKTNMG